MTEEELKKEAKEYISDNCKRWEFDGLTVDDIANEAYLAGAKPREKQIAELEKEKCELLGIIQGKDKAIKNLKKENKVLAQNLEDTEIINKALEKENAELKEQCSILADCNSCTSSCKTENLEMKKQLTKAKELLKKFIETSNPIYFEEDRQKVKAEAEQFISEVEKCGQ